MSLRKIIEVTLAGEKLDLARNGEGYRLVRTAPDAYGNPRGVEVDLHAWLDPEQQGRRAEQRAQALLDRVGELVERVQSQKDLALAAQGGGEGA